MPDGSKDCGIILGKLEVIERLQLAHASAVKIEIDQIKEKLARMDDIERVLNEIRLKEAREDGAINAAQWVLARIGAFVVLFLGAIGWLITGEHWLLVKRWFQ